MHAVKDVCLVPLGLLQKVSVDSSTLLLGKGIVWLMYAS